ncbi:MAG: hypothetical protein KDA60_04800 [Planctomycetales bacterium]|nr:hypothetical protein [Planctomycetales bacterium]
MHKHSQARAAWRRAGGVPANTGHVRDYARGWKSGYYDVATGSNGIAPALPPKRYWATKYQSPRGQESVREWYAGYQRGAAAAQSRCLDDLNAVPHSGLEDMEIACDSESTIPTWIGASPLAANTVHSSGDRYFAGAGPSRATNSPPGDVSNETAADDLIAEPTVADAATQNDRPRFSMDEILAAGRFASEQPAAAPGGSEPSHLVENNRPLTSSQPSSKLGADSVDVTPRNRADETQEEVRIEATVEDALVAVVPVANQVDLTRDDELSSPDDLLWMLQSLPANQASADESSAAESSSVLTRRPWQPSLPTSTAASLTPVAMTPVISPTRLAATPNETTATVARRPISKQSDQCAAAQADTDKNRVADPVGQSNSPAQSLSDNAPSATTSSRRNQPASSSNSVNQK